MTELFESLDGVSAEFSPDEIYRYTLTRQWDDGKCIAWLLFNPSTATATTDDATIRKAVGFSRRWGFARFVIINLYAIRSTDPKKLKNIADPIGPMNDFWISKSVGEARELICAWGCAQHMQNIVHRVKHVLKLIAKAEPHLEINCLGYRKDNHPRHPLMLPYEMQRVPFEIRL